MMFEHFDGRNRGTVDQHLYCLYLITLNGQQYVGQTNDTYHRFISHRSSSSGCIYIRDAIQKYGWDNFVWEPIYQSRDQEHTLKIMEPYFINEYRSWVGFEDCNGYNITLGGEGTSGYRRSAELIESHRQKMKGRKFTPEHIAKRVASFK